MSRPTVLRVNRATAAEIAVHLESCDASFVPPLSTRVNISEYSDKIVNNAERFEAWFDGVMVGLVAAYFNNPGKATAFITSVSVLPSWRDAGIASEMIARCVAYGDSCAFKRIQLEVDSGNLAAVRLYKTCGFSLGDSVYQTVTMYVNLEKET